MQSPSSIDMQAVKHILRYIKGKINFGIHLISQTLSVWIFGC